MIFWTVLGLWATALSCQPPLPQAAFSQDTASSAGYQQQDQGVASYTQASWEPYPGYKEPPPPQQGQLEPLSRALSAPLAPSGQAAAPLENLPPPGGNSNSLQSEVAAAAIRSCEEIKSLGEFEACIQETSLPSRGQNAWKCGFEAGSECRFAPVSDGFAVGRLPMPSAYASFSEFTSKLGSDSPEGEFLYAVSPQGLRKGESLFISTQIPCQKGDGVLKLSFWLYPPEGQVRVCTADDHMRSCTQPFVHTNQSSVIVAVINPIRPGAQSSTFDLEIEATELTNPSIFAIDNLDYRADFCQPKVDAIVDSGEQFFESEEHQAPSSEIRRSQPKIPKRPNRLNSKEDIEIHNEKMQAAMNAEIGSLSDEFFEEEEMLSTTLPKVRSQTKSLKKQGTSNNACETLRCSFERNFCGWRNLGDGVKYGEWRHKGYNRHLASLERNEAEIGDDAGIAYAGSDTTPSPLYRQKTFILESPEIFAMTNLTLLYDVKRQTDDITLQLCFDTPNYCPYKLSPFKDETTWRIDEAVVVPEGSRRIFFKAIQWRKYSRLLIDNIRVLGC
ncbi:unnamed protein product, partial [Mesorhabditis spiculigera]